MAQMPDSPLTCLDLWCKAGSFYEKEGEEGLAHFLEHMVFKGSSKLKEGEFDKQIEALGGSSNAATGFDDVHYYVLVPPENVITAIDLLTNLVLNPALDKTAYSLERQVVLEEIAQHKDQPEEQVFQCLLKNCWGSHAYGRSILGLEKTLLASSPNEMSEFHKRQYQTSNMAISIAGVIPENILEILEKSDLTRINYHSILNPLENKISNLIFKTGRKEIEIPRLESVRLTIAWPLSPAKDQMMIMGADIVTSLLAEGRNSIFIKRLREELQIVESIYMDITALEQGGLYILEVCCLEENINAVESEIQLILRNYLCNEVTSKELMRAKKLVTNSLCFSLELPSQIAAIAGSQVLWNRHQQLLEPLKYIDSWNANNIKDLIFKQLQLENSFTLISRPVNK
ncbi:M16 family metallopeptidase [Prochlorococcus marinus]|uniref:M16 family metallopeptidase n=1 Tax=Prochlorococcus marinus TaxID=1219 RepID=UPI0022B5A69F|nr:pitrilysin family protein [Prochlorococcus marinus]